MNILGNQPVKNQHPYTILGLGDSITEGGDYFSSYLFPLWEKLFSKGYSVDFIGPRQQKCRIGELNHAGHSGQDVEFLESRIDSVYHKYPADIILMHAGHNHSAEEEPIPGMISAYKSIITKVKQINPDVIIMIAQVINSGKLPKYSYIPQLNEEIARMVRGLDDPNVILVDQYSNFDWEKHTVEDKVHPNKEGAEIMAETWFSVLTKVLPCPIPSIQ